MTPIHEENRGEHRSGRTSKQVRWLMIAVCAALIGWPSAGWAADSRDSEGATNSVETAQATPSQAPKDEPAAQPAESEAVAETETMPVPVATGQIVVTARKREETLADVPVAVSVITGDDLTRNDMTSVTDMSQLVPSLNVNSDAASRAFVSIRGIGTALFNTVEPGVGIFLNGVYLPATAYANNPTLDVQRIEVLKGPQGTLYGKNTLGGAINIITRPPTDDFEAQVTADYFSGDAARSGSFRLSGPIVPGSLRGRIAAAVRRTDGFFENSLIGGPIDNTSSDSVNGSLTWDVSNSFDISANFYYLDLTGPQTAYGAPSDIRDFSDGIYKLNVSSSADLTYSGGNLRLGLKTPSINSQLTAIFAHDRQEMSAYVDGDFSPVDMFRQTGTGNRKSTTAELRIDTTWSDSVTTLFGVFGSRDEQDNATITHIVPLGLDLPDSSQQTIDAFAVFGTVFWRLAKDYELTFGLRYDDNKAVLNAAGDVANPSRTIENSHVAPRVSLAKFWSSEQMTYMSVARGDREGGFNSTLVPPELWVIQPDKVWAAELGHKVTLGGGRTNLAGAVFYNDYTDFIGQNTFVLRDDGNGFSAAVVNQGDAESYGVEGEISSQIGARWLVSADVSYVHARATNQDGWIAATGGPLATDRLIFQPDWTFNLQAQYSIPIASNLLSFRAGVYGKGDAVGATQAQPPAPAPIMDSYYLVNASVSYTIRDLQIQLFCSNLTDQGYWYSYIDDSLTGFPLGIQGAKRKVGLQLAYWF